MKFENVTIYYKQSSEEEAQAHIEMIAKVKPDTLVDFGVGYDEKRGWHSWRTRKEWVDTRGVKEDE